MCNGSRMADEPQSDDFPYLPSGPAAVNKMIQEYGDLFSDSKCTVCSAVLIAESQKLTHYQSRKHANKVRRYLSLKKDQEPQTKKLSTSVTQEVDNGEVDRMKLCQVCNMTFTSAVVAQSHYVGKVHAKNLKLGAKTQISPPTQTVTPKKPPCGESDAPDNNNAEADPDRFCGVCGVSFNNPLIARQHYEGKKHRKHMTKVKLMETYGPSPATVQGYSCSLCNIQLNSVEQYQSHISGSKHKNRMKKSEQEQPAGEEPAGGEPAGGEPAGGEPAGGEPAGGEPAEEEPAGEEPAGEEPEEEEFVDEEKLLNDDDEFNDEPLNAADEPLDDQCDAGRTLGQLDPEHAEY